MELMALLVLPWHRRGICTIAPSRTPLYCTRRPKLPRDSQLQPIRNRNVELIDMSLNNVVRMHSQPALYASEGDEIGVLRGVSCGHVH